MSQAFQLSIVICAHNPRREYLTRVLKALQRQTMPRSLWELLLIDNASKKSLADDFDLSWHIDSQHVYEASLGLTSARVRGINEARGNVLLFVDDDNVLQDDYLETAYKISQDWPQLGAWGGQLVAEFEQEPPEWTKRYLWMLAIREFDKDAWSNLVNQFQTVPFGAGLCVRREVADVYANLTNQDPKRRNMDRRGELLISGGDIDLAFTACDIGLGTGIFTSLKLTHLIPSNRLQEDYLLKLAESISYSKRIVEHFRDSSSIQQNDGLTSTSRQHRFFNAFHRGTIRAEQEIKEWSISK